MSEDSRKYRRVRATVRTLVCLVPVFIFIHYLIVTP